RGASRPSAQWKDDDFDVLADGIVVGRIVNAAAAPVGSPWLWTYGFDPRERRRVRADTRSGDGGDWRRYSSAWCATPRTRIYVERGTQTQMAANNKTAFFPHLTMIQVGPSHTQARRGKHDLDDLSGGV